MIAKKADHIVHPGRDHTKWSTSEAVKQAALEAVGLSNFISSEALPELFQQVMGPQDEDETFHASTVISTTKAVIKEAEAVMAERAKAEKPDEDMWDRGRVSNLEKQWALEAKLEEDAEMQKTMRIPSSVSIPHVDTGASAKGTKLIGKSDLDGSASTKVKTKRPAAVRVKKRAAVEAAEGDVADPAVEGAEGSKPKKVKRSKASAPAEGVEGSEPKQAKKAKKSDAQSS